MRTSSLIRSMADFYCVGYARHTPASREPTSCDRAAYARTLPARPCPEIVPRITELCTWNMGDGLEGDMEVMG